MGKETGLFPAEGAEGGDKVSRINRQSRRSALPRPAATVLARTSCHPSASHYGLSFQPSSWGSQHSPNQTRMNSTHSSPWALSRALVRTSQVRSSASSVHSARTLPAAPITPDALLQAIARGARAM